MKLHNIKTHRKTIAGNVLLPLFGFVYWFPCMMVYLALFMAGIAGIAKATHPIIAIPVALVGWFLVTPFVTLFLAMMAEMLEEMATHAGVGAGQYWTGKNVFEKVCREIFRWGTFLVGGAVAFYLASHAKLPHSTLAANENLAAAQAMLFGAGWQISFVLLTLVLIAIKSAAPGFGWFKGDPKYRYPHIF